MPRAVQFTRFGGPEVLSVVDVARPEPIEGQLLVHVVVASLNPAEVGIREGAFAQIWPADFPMGQGHDFSGVVAALGPGVTGFEVGDPVIGFAPRAAMADFTVIDASTAAKMPEGIDFASAATIPASGATGWAGVAAVDPGEGETVFVSSASGGAGVFTVQLARLRGARVLGGTSSANAHRLEGLGIEPVAYGPGLSARLRDLAPSGIDAVIDTFGGGYVDLAIELGVAPARINTIADYAAVSRYGVQSQGNGNAMSPEIWTALQDLVVSGQLIVPVEAEYPLEDIRRAYIDVATRHGFGKRVVRLRPDPR
ncbi:NADP-dependent oxidoreductase [Kutzneria sp. 744]|uniref:NADP-dependent oxidoreductase n=1 Tax=Kutzneria sp. (strain 744) TaxID=345341 RepID=UPI0004B37542|nr:NADP-dependent oxidoreductase [Kutzneria sp. 744]